MRKRPILSPEEHKFLEGAEASLSEREVFKEDLHRYVKKIDWPLDKTEISPSMANGSSLRKLMTFAFNESEWKSIDRHTKALGISKTEWVRYAIFKLMQEEQIYCMKHRK